MPPPTPDIPFNFTEIPFSHVSANSVYWVNSELVITVMLILMMCSLFQTLLLCILVLKRR